MRGSLGFDLFNVKTYSVILNDNSEIPITLDDQQDLLDIPGFYQKGSGNFWLALHGSEIIGTIALLDIGHGQGALRKMFVKAQFRGSTYGVARRLSTFTGLD